MICCKHCDHNWEQQQGRMWSQSKKWYPGTDFTESQRGNTVKMLQNISMKHPWWDDIWAEKTSAVCQNKSPLPLLLLEFHSPLCFSFRVSEWSRLVQSLYIFEKTVRLPAAVRSPNTEIYRMTVCLFPSSSKKTRQMWGLRTLQTLVLHW